MTRSLFSDKLPELQQIEAIIQKDHKKFLSSKNLCHISGVNETLPIYYALSLGNQAADITQYYVCWRDSWARADWYPGCFSLS